MHNNKVYTILQHFDKNDFKQFNKYINSPYFNKSKLLTQYFQLLEKQIHSKNPEDFPKEKFWKKLFPNQTYNDVRFRKLSSNLLKIIEGFLTQEVFEKKILQKDGFLIEAIGQKGLEKYYLSFMKTAENDIEKFPFEDSEFYLDQYQIQKNYHNIIQNEYKHSERHNIEKIDELLNKFYLSEKLRYFCAALSQQQRGTHVYNLKYSDEILSLVKSIKVDDIPPLAIYYQIYLTYIEEENDTHYFRLKELLKTHGQKFQSIEGKTLYDSAINYGVKKLNKGNANFLQEIFDVYVDFLKKELIYIDGELDPSHFRNIATVALRLGKYEWTENFIKQQKSRLPESKRENAITFNIARLYYYQKKYDEAISLLNTVEYEELIYNLSSKSLLLAMYYEKDEVEALYSLLDSFRTFLNRRKDIPESWKPSRINLIKFTKKLTRIIPGDTAAIEKLKKEINEAKSVADEQWLKEKIAELE